MNFYSINSFLQDCSQSKSLKTIKKFHAHIVRTGLIFFFPNLQTKLILTYATCFNNIKTRNSQTFTNLFKFLNPRNPLPFNSIISHFSQSGHHSLALQTISFMHFNGVSMDSYAICSSLTSSSGDQNLIFGEIMHAFVVKSGWFSSVFVGSALIDLCAKLSGIDDATKVFDEMPVKNTVCVNALLSGLAEAKMWNQGLKLVRKIPWLELDYDHFTFAAALRCSVGLSAMEFGRQIHGIVVRQVWDLGADVFLQSLLIEMYGKCGLVEKAEQIFSLAGFTQGMEIKRDVVLWTSLLGVYGKNGNHESVIMLFREMLDEGIRPDGVAFLAVISACGHTGQVDLAFEYFTSMAHDFGLILGPEHYSCLIDSLCRAGELEKAWKLISEMPCEITNNCTVAMWGTVLSACSECGNVELGKLAGQRALQLEPENTGIIVLLSNMYANHGMWDEIEQLRESMKGRKIIKDIGCSWVDVAS
ncbi:OLC1v1003384C1 [Oldenlandia corymbosa var. corymbosa]|uniref:OLC1v1003384C1 n=1 Tax=Oldenlandia corymbosa var. corymbosa TaxID=529605 RepID=A0AAV1DBS7_OLDCO|nr:OLC1v1003384C1 [Oldenlandia corymbosa var. corymbosa]